MLRRVVANLAWIALVALTPSAAGAVELSFKLEPGVAAAVSAPQAQLYGVGGGQSAKALFGVTSYLDVGPSASFVIVPVTGSPAEAGDVGGIWGFGGGLRLKRPHDTVKFYGISPWIDADMLFIRTGTLNRSGFDAAIGLSVPVGESRNFWIGPFIRYLQVIEPNHEGFDSRDARMLTLGLSFEIGPGVQQHKSAPVEVPIPAQERIVQKEVLCPDRDRDGFPDTVDHCPDVAGMIDNWGCPKYQKIVVRDDKLELKEKIQFASDLATLDDVSFPVLDEVVQALKDYEGFRVQIEGHTSSEGSDDHNQVLSDSRAAAVLDYIWAHGVSKERLSSKGFGSTVPIDTNTTAAGRENNRRVEFVISFITPLNAKSAQ